jgi:hypothetical protein
MKIPYLAPATLLASAFIAPLASAQTFATDLPGNVSPLTINLTINETIGGHRVTPQIEQRDAARNITYPDTIRFDAVYNPGSPAPALLNPFGWDTPGVNNYVERVVTTNSNGTTVVTANGSHTISRTRFTNATLLSDLVASGRISSAQGYRLVAVRFDVPTEIDALVYDTGPHLSIVRPGLYFFAERGANDPSPIFLGAEDNIYAAEQVIDFASFETAENGRYVDRFTNTGAGFDYELVSDSYSGLALAELAIYRRIGGNGQYYQMRAGGTFNWSETYDNRQNRNTYNRGPIIGRNLTGPAALFSAGESTGEHEAIVTGIVTMPAAAFQGSLKRYLDALPPIAN